jgi:hypothetical protein
MRRFHFRAWLLAPVLRYLQEIVMPSVVDVQAKLDAVNAAIEAETTQVASDLQGLRDQITALQGQITQQDLQPILDGLDQVISRVEGIDPDAVTPSP